jgi:hypothetical protein
MVSFEIYNDRQGMQWNLAIQWLCLIILANLCAMAIAVVFWRVAKKLVEWAVFLAGFCLLCAIVFVLLRFAMARTFAWLPSASIGPLLSQWQHDLFGRFNATTVVDWPHWLPWVNAVAK